MAGSSTMTSSNESDLRLTQHPSSKRDGTQSEHPKHDDPAEKVLRDPLLPVLNSSHEAPISRHFWLRSACNIVGPIILVLCYVFIAYHYILRQPVNDVAPHYWVDPRLVFYGWFLISVFSLNWASSGIAGTEAAALMHPRLAPKSILQTLWHADRAWDSVSGWCRAILVTLSDDFARLNQKHGRIAHRNPNRLWWYLCFDSILFFVAIPLSGLSMELGDALRPSNQKALLTGPNATTLDTIEPFDLSVHVGTRWLSGRKTTFASPALLYAPEGALDVSGTYFDDLISSFADRTETIQIFAGPNTAARVHGRAWGVQSNISCRQANPYNDLTLIKVVSSTNYSAFNTSNGAIYIDTDIGQPDNVKRQLISGSRMPFYTILTAIRDCTNADFCYSNAVLDCGWHIGECDHVAGQTKDTTPVQQAFELVIYQSEPNLAPDPAWLAMRKLPIVVSEPGNDTYAQMLGYGIHCDITSGTGLADLSPSTRTWSNFSPAGAELTGGLGTNQAVPIQILSKVALQPFNTWYATNSAINGEPYAVDSVDRQYAAITPERMQVSMYKLLGQAVVEAMSREFPPWEGELMTVTPTKVITPGKISWQFILGLLTVWAVITVIPTIPALFVTRWAATLNGFEFFRLGVETGEARQDVGMLAGKEFWECEELAKRDARWWKDGGRGGKIP